MATSETPAGPGTRPGPADRRARRADAERSIASILDAALACFNRSPDATMTEIAAAAGVGRVTLYGHFPSREAVLDALLRRNLADGMRQMDAIRPDEGSAVDAFRRFVHSPWMVERIQGVLTAATRHLGEERVRELHGPVLARVEQLIARGQDEGAFRTDLPRTWLVTAVYALAHAAIQEHDRGRMTTATAADLVTESLLSLLRPPPTG